MSDFTFLFLILLSACHVYLQPYNLMPVNFSVRRGSPLQSMLNASVYANEQCGTLITKFVFSRGSDAVPTVGPAQVDVHMAEIPTFGSYKINLLLHDGESLLFAAPVLQPGIFDDPNWSSTFALGNFMYSCNQKVGVLNKGDPEDQSETCNKVPATAGQCMMIQKDDDPPLTPWEPVAMKACSDPGALQQHCANYDGIYEESQGLF